MGVRKPKENAAGSTDEAGFIACIKAQPDDTTTRAAYADWLDEHGRPIEAAQQRDAAGLSEVRYKLRRKSDGLFSEGNRWTTKGKGWRKLGDLNKHLGSVHSRARREAPLTYLETPLNDLEVVVVEVRATAIASLPLNFKTEQRGKDTRVTFGPIIGAEPA